MKVNSPSAMAVTVLMAIMMVWPPLPLGYVRGAAKELPQILIGHETTYDFGRNVSFIGDFNRDGFTDAAVTDPDNNTVYLYFGPRSGNLSPAWSSVRIVSNSSEAFGASCSGVGDVDGDGYDDIVIGAPANSSNTGAAYLFYGYNYTNGTTMYSTDANMTFQGWNPGDYFGSSVAAGDINGDGSQDIVISAAGNSTNAFYAGAAYIYLSPMDNISDWNITGNYTWELLGYSLDVYDFNGDGYDDIAAGCPYNNSAQGAVRVFYYTPGRADANSTGANITVEGHTSSRFGHTLWAGDIGSRGGADLVVGAPANNSYAGAVYVFYNISSRGNISLSSGGIANLTVDGLSAGDAFGWSLDYAGDFNMDGRPLDFAIGAPGVDTGANNSGAMYILCMPAIISGNVTSAVADYVMYGDRGNYILGYSLSAAMNFTLNSSLNGYMGVLVSANNTAIYTEYSPLIGQPHHLELSAQPNTTSVEGFINITVRVVDIFGNPASGSGTVNISVSSGRINATNMTVLKSAYNYVNGTVSRSVYIHINNTNVTTVSVNVTYTDLVLTGAENIKVEFTAGDPYRLVVSDYSPVQTAGEKSAFLLSVVDRYGNPTVMDVDRWVFLEDNSTTGLFYEIPFGVPVTHTVFYSGWSNLTLYYNNTAVGYYVFNATNASLVSGSGYVQVLNSTPYGVQIVSPPSSVTAGEMTPAITVELVDYYGNPVQAPSDVNITLTSNASVYWFYNSTLEQVNWTVITAGNTSTTAAFMTTVAGYYYMSFLPDGGYAGKASMITVLPAAADHLRISSYPVSGNAGDDLAIAVVLEDQYGNPTQATVDIDIELDSNATFHNFSLTPGGPAINTITMSTGQSTVTFYFNTSQAGIWSVNCTNTTSYVTGDGVVIDIGPAAASALDIFQADTTVVAGGTGHYYVRLLDRFGNVIAPASSVTVELSSNATGTWEFRLSPTGASVTQVFIPAGDKSIDFYFYAERAQVCSLNVSSTGLEGDSVLVSVVASSPVALEFINSTYTATAGDNVSLDIVFYDQFHNPADGGGLTVALHSDSTSPNWQFYYGGAPTDTVAVTGGTTVRVYYRDTLAGRFTITASSDPLTPGVATFIYNPGDPSGYNVSSPKDAIAGTPFNLSVSINDVYSNICTQDSNTTVSLNITGGSLVNGSTATTDHVVNGSLTLSLVSYTTGVISVYLSLPLGDSVENTTVHPAETYRIALGLSSDDIVAGDDVTIILTGYDVYNNTAIEDSQTAFTVDLNLNGESVILNGTLTNGTYNSTVTLEKAGTYVVSVLAAVPVVGWDVVTVHPGDIYSAIASQLDSPSVSDGVSVEYVFYDAYGNQAVEDTVTAVTITVGGLAVFDTVDGTSISPSNQYTTTVSGGSLTAHITDELAETVEVNCTGIPGTAIGVAISFDDDVGPIVSNAAVTPNPTTGRSHVTITALVSDEVMGGSTVLSADVYVDALEGSPAAKLMPADGAADSAKEEMSGTLDVSSLTLGEHTLLIVGRDAFNNTGDAGEVTFTVSTNHPPQAVASILADGKDLPSTITNKRPIISWSASTDPDPIDTNIGYYLSIGTISGASDVLGPLYVSGTIYSLSEDLEYGVYYITVVATDGLDNSTPTSAELTISPPGNHAPLPPTEIIPSETSDTTPTISWSGATDSDGDTLTYWIRIGSSPSSGDILEWTHVSDGNSYTVSTPLAEGTYYVQVKAFDGVMNSSAFQSTVTVNVGNTAPIPPTSVTIDGIELEAGATTEVPAGVNTINWSGASDPDGDSITYLIAIGSAEGKEDILAKTPLGSSTGFDLSAHDLVLNQGWMYYIVIYVRDSKGMESHTERIIRVTSPSEMAIGVSIEPQSVTLKPGESATITVTFTNPLSNQLVITLLPSFPSGLSPEIGLDNPHIVVGASSSLSVDITITIPEDAKSGEYTIRFTATGSGVESGSADLRVTVEESSSSTAEGGLSYGSMGVGIAALLVIILVVAIILYLRNRETEEVDLVNLEDIESDIEEFFEEEEPAPASTSDESAEEQDEDMLSESEIEDDVEESDLILTSTEESDEPSGDAVETGSGEEDMLDQDQIEQLILKELESMDGGLMDEEEGTVGDGAEPENGQSEEVDE